MNTTLHLEKNMSDLIFIHNIPTQAIIGIHDFERATPQKLIISLEMGTDIRPAAASDHVDDALNYDAISRFVDKTVQQSQFELLETLAEALVRELFSRFAMTSIRLKIQKPGAIAYTQMVGLEISRQRQDYV